MRLVRPCVIRIVAITVLFPLLTASTAAAGSPASLTASGTMATAIETGFDHSCALTTAGGVKCWGSNEWGQLGDGTTTTRLTPVDVVGLTSGVAAISAGGDHTCALTTAGGVKCWGRNRHGQVGDGTWTNRFLPVDVSGLTSGVAAISAGSNHTCALTTAGGVKCWGWGEFGELGDGTGNRHHTPVDVSGLTSGVAAISAGHNVTCAITTMGGMRCWGDNFNGQLGDGTNVGRLTPVDVSGLTSGVTSMSVGLGQTCAVTSAGGAKCWGYNHFGELGDGTTTDRLTPVDVSGLTSGVATISGNEFHTCAVTTAGGAKCWGFNGTGAVGDGTLHRRLTPVDVNGLTSGVATISTGVQFTCALKTAGAATCWGSGFNGQLGDGSTDLQLLPVDVYGLPVIKASRLVRFLPQSGSVGTRVRVFGKNFIDVVGVSFHGSTRRILQGDIEHDDRGQSAAGSNHRQDHSHDGRR